MAEQGDMLGQEVEEGKMRHKILTITHPFMIPTTTIGSHYSLDWTTGLAQNGVKCLFKPFSV